MKKIKNAGKEDENRGYNKQVCFFNVYPVLIYYGVGDKRYWL
jgi:hypothetical protein